MEENLSPSMADPDRAPAGVRIAAEPFGAPDSQALLAEHASGLIERYGKDTESGAKPTERDVAAFLVARDSAGRPVGCGALRDLGDGAAEIKRMYVRPYARGAGLGRRLLSALEDEARSQGFGTCRLETGELQGEAMALYRRAGYREIGPFGPYVGSAISRCFERQLDT